MKDIVHVNGREVKVVNKELQKILKSMEKHKIHYINILNERKHKTIYVGDSKQILYAYAPNA